MANAIKKISVARGYDVTRYALNCFGGAGGQHACLVADALGMKTVLIHPFSGLLSAYGMGLADIRATRTQAIEESFGEAAQAAIAKAGELLVKQAAEEVAGQGVARGDIRVHVRAHIRYAGTDTPLEVPAYTIERADNDRGASSSMTLGAMKAAFEAAHRARFGFIDDTKEIVVEAVSVEAVGGGAKFSEKEIPATQRTPARPPARKTRFFSGGTWHEAGVWLRERFAAVTASRGRRSSSSRTRPSSSRTAGRRRSRARTISCSRASKRSRGRKRSAPRRTR